MKENDGELMTKEQVIGLARHLLPLFGGMAIAQGYFSDEEWKIFSEQFLEILGPTLTLVGGVWTVYDKTDKSLVAKAIALPDVAKIECCDTKEGAALADSVPHKDVVTELPDRASGLHRVAQAYPKTK